MGLAAIDYLIVAIYAISLVAIATWVSREKSGHDKDTKDYFLAGNSLPWWAIGASLIAANISAEQVIGMTGSGYAIGLAIASYEWMAAITLIIVGKYFLPIFLERRIYTMPQFLEQRYNGAVRSVMAVFWLGVFTFVNLASILWLGALTVKSMTGLDLNAGIAALAAFAAIYSLYGGLKAVALTDIIQVAMLVAGGLIISWLALDHVSGGNGAIAGFTELMRVAPQKFDMILAESDPNYRYLPGLSVLIGGMWIMNLSYWGFNQYIIQRALAAKSVEEAQKGIVFAAFLKLLIPVLVVFPGIAAFVLAPDLGRPDEAYPTMMSLAPNGIRGLIFVALIAAIVSSLGSMMNSIATIFTMDLYKHVRPQTSEHSLVLTGRLAAFIALVIAALAARPLLGNAEQAFQWLQEFTGFFTPGVVTLFVLGMFWSRTTSAGAFAAAIGSALFSLAYKIWWPEVPFMNRVGWVFLLCVATAVLVSLLAGGRVQEKAVDVGRIDFSTRPSFNLAAAIIAAILILLYWYWW
jgi:SSS family solute:Na+ symporter